MLCKEGADSRKFPIRFPISEIRNRKLLWAFRVFGNQTVILELIRHTLNLSLQRHKCPPLFFWVFPVKVPLPIEKVPLLIGNLHYPAEAFLIEQMPIRKFVILC